MDPLTITAAMSVANSAFNAIKQGFAAARDIEQMSGDIGRWMGAVSDIDNAEKQAKNPPLFGKLFKAGSIEEAALSAYAAKKKLEEQRYELKIFSFLITRYYCYTFFSIPILSRHSVKHVSLRTSADELRI